MTEAQINLAAKATANEGFHVKLSGETDDMARTCVHCLRERPLVLFPRKRRFGDGKVRRWVCQGCIDAAPRRRRTVPRAAPQSATPTTRKAARMWESARLRAWRQRVPFDLPKQWVLDRLEAGRCEVTGLEFKPNVGGRRYGNFVPSIDREVPELGYTVENCRLVVWVYNCAKGAGSHEDVVAMALALIDRESNRRGWQTKKRLAAARAASEAGKMENAA
jgi:hypothetical protein